MALDGVYLSLVKKEMERLLISSRVEKIHQPSRENLIITLRTRSNGVKKVLFSANAGNARAHLSKSDLENPKAPPMFCMLLRKHLGSAQLVNIRQDGFERILYFDFEATDELGDRVTLTLAAEIMGRCSNIILINQNGRVIDSIKRVSEDMSSVRMVLPGIEYALPPREERANLFSFDRDMLTRTLLSSSIKSPDKQLVKAIEGISPIFAREAVYFALRGGDKPTSEFTPDEISRLIFYLEQTAKSVLGGENKFTLVRDRDGMMKDYCFTEIHQYGPSVMTKEFESPSELLDCFYTGRDTALQMRQRAADLFKLLVSLSERIQRRVSAQKLGLAECANRDDLRIKGDLIMANLYRIEKGDRVAVLQNFYDGGSPEIEISLDPRLTPSQNAQHYYREYRKADTAEKMLRGLIAAGEQEYRYIDSVFDSLSRASTDAELSEIKAELASEGYIKNSRAKGNGKSKGEKTLPPIEYISSDGYKISAGRNNRQNDMLTLKTADKSDIWLHVKDFTGSHVIISAHGGEVPKRTVEEAALIAAYNSSAKNSSTVPVDYTLVRYVKKPAGAKPGMVIFTNQKTLYVNPDDETVAALKSQKKGRNPS